jgi:hypothetical protein
MLRKVRGILGLRVIALLTACVVSSSFFFVVSPALAESHDAPEGIRISEIGLEAGVPADNRNFRLDCRDSQGNQLQRCGLRYGGWELLANDVVVDSASFPGGEIYTNDITVEICPGTDYIMRAWIVTRASDRLTDSMSFTTPSSQNLPPECAISAEAAGNEVISIRLSPESPAAGQSADQRNFRLDCRDSEGNQRGVCEHRSGGWELFENGAVVASSTLPGGEAYDVAITVGIQPETSYTLQAWMVTEAGVRLDDSMSFTTPGGIKELYSFTRRSTGSVLD